MSEHANSRKTILYALGANLAIAVAKGVAAALTGSGAMVAETVHSLADCGNQGLLLLGMRQAARPPSEKYPLGEGRALYFWSFVVALMLFSLGGMFSLYEGAHKLQSREPVQAWWWAVGVLVFGVVAEAISMRACLKEVAKSRGGRSLWRWFRESREVALVVVFGEDLAALLGLSVALVAVVISVVTGDPRWDAIGTLGIGVLLIVIALFVAINVKALLIGQSPDPELSGQIRRWLADRPEVAEVYNVVLLQQGDEVLLSVKAKLGETSSVPALLGSINRVEAELKKAFPVVRWSFFEPDDTP